MLSALRWWRAFRVGFLGGQEFLLLPPKPTLSVRDRSPQGRDAQSAALSRHATRARRASARDAHLDALLDIAANILRRFLIADDLKRVCWQHAGLDRFDLIGRRVQPFFTGALAG